jgi:hypothetical protein
VRKVTRDVHEDVRDQVRALANTEAFQQSRRERKKIEMRFAHMKRFLLQRADRAVVLVGPVVDDVALIDVAGAGQLHATWANVNIALPVEDEVGSAEPALPWSG